jgi:hypothetical protein
VTNAFTIPKQSIFTRDKKEANSLSYVERGRKNGAKRALQINGPAYGVTKTKRNEK